MNSRRWRLWAFARASEIFFESEEIAKVSETKSKVWFLGFLRTAGGTPSTGSNNGTTS
jgi:hypothetical protein